MKNVPMPSMKKQHQRQEPKIVARYGKDYVITQGVTNGMHYVFYKDEFLGLGQLLSNAISYISLHCGAGFDINMVEIL